MSEALMAMVGMDMGALMMAEVFAQVWYYILIILGFSLVIFFHELGHFFAAKACRVRVHKFAIGFGKELFGFTRGETRYAFNVLPLGGYVKMLGQEDFGDKEGELVVKDDPRAFSNKPVGQRMFIVSAGVIMNLVFAAVVFMMVFMIGLESLPAEIGWLAPGSPAEQAGLRIGDKIVQVNNTAISDQSDLRAAVVLSDPDEPLKITYRRKDPVSGVARTETVTIHPEKNSEQNILQIGVAPPLDTKVAMVIREPALADDDQLKTGDQILSVNGRKATNFFDVLHALAGVKGQFADIRIRRPTTQPADQETAAVERSVKWRASMFFLPDGKVGESSGHLLGLVPRVKITEVTEGQRADDAGLKAGDVVVRWGHQVAPRADEIADSIGKNPDTPIPVEVLRYHDGGKPQTLNLEVTPRVPGWLFKRSPQIGATFQGQENDQIVIADIVAEGYDKTETPAARIKNLMPRGSLITKVQGEPVATWSALVERLIKLAGNEVRLSWIYEGQPEASGIIYVPRTLGTVFALPGSYVITAIDGEARAETEFRGKRRDFAASTWIGAREILKKKIGKTVSVEFWNQADRTFHKEELAVTQEMLDTWVLRVQYNVDDVITHFDRVLVREKNPVRAMMIGVRKTYHFIGQVYVTMRRMIFTRSMGLDQISGPVGIIKLGSDLAAAGLPVLMYFLALISANLAVINFLPLPIFDGGLFVFLIIEKIKGAPVSMKVQVATQMIGLVLIIGIFVFVTVQDILKLGGWE